MTPEMQEEEFGDILEELRKRAEISSINLPQRKHTSQEIEASLSAYPEGSKSIVTQKLDDLDAEIESTKAL